MKQSCPPIAMALAVLTLAMPAFPQDFGSTVSAAMDAFREVRTQNAAPDNIKAIFAKANNAEEDGCINFCGFYLGMSETDASALATHYGLKGDQWGCQALPSSRAVYSFTFTLHGIRRVTRGGNTFDELSQAVANRIGTMSPKRNGDYDLIGYEYKNIDNQTALISEGKGLVLTDPGLERKRKDEAVQLAAAVICSSSEKVQLWEGGPYWATKNIGAKEPSDYGLYFWWGDTVGYQRVGDAWVASDGSSSDFKFNEECMPTGVKSIEELRSDGWIAQKDGADVLALAHDAAHVHWGGNWRMPTHQELSDLNSKCDWIFTKLNSVNGYVVIGRGDYATSIIFFPAAGRRYGTSLYDAGSFGYYWSSVPDSDSSLFSWILGFYSGYYGVYEHNRNYGQPVRPVQGFAE